MDFTTKKILNNGRYILSTISGFLNAITYFIIPYFNANIATKVVQNNFQRTLLSKSESSTSPLSSESTSLVTTTTTRRRRTKTPFTFSSKFESSALAPLPSSPSPSATTTTRTTTKTPSIFSSKSESSTSAPPPSSTTTTRGTTTRAPSIFSSKSESTLAPPLALPSPSPTTKTTTTTTPSTFSSLFDSTPYSSPWMYSTSGDLIGSESGVFMASPSELEEYEQQYRNRKPKNNIVKKGKQPKNLKKEYPPPIPSWRGKLPGDVPWSLSRHNVDGRLILKEESMEYYEYLEATRVDGRLVLKLIVLKGNIKHHNQNDFDDTIHEDEITRDETINQREKKKRIQEETQRDFVMINGEIETKKRRGHY